GVPDDVDNLIFNRIDGELFGFPVVAVSVGDPPAVPLAVAGPGQHDSGNALGSHVPFQLREDQDDFEHGLADSVAGVELLVFADEGHAQVLQFFVHGGKVQYISADTVDLPDQQVRELAGAQPSHHELVVRPVGVFGGIAGVLEDNVVRYAQHHLGVYRQLPPLYLQRIPVYLIPRRHADIDGRLLLFQIVRYRHVSALRPRRPYYTD